MFGKKFRYNYSNIAFVCKKRYMGFEKGRIYKPFAYSVKYNDSANCYTNFALFDNLGEIFIMPAKLVKKGYFDITLFSELISNEYAQSFEMMVKLDEINDNLMRRFNKKPKEEEEKEEEK